MLEKINEVLKFWFNEQATFDSTYGRALWDEENTAFDTEFKHQFESLYYIAVKGKLNSWLRQPKSCLAFIILVHQMPRRIYRGTPTAYQFDPLAIKAAEKGRDHKLDKDLLLIERLFFYIPYMYSEEIMHQRLSLILFQKLLNEAKEQKDPALDLLNKFNSIAMQNCAIIQSFDRFPTRNEILGRESTQAETLFLNFPNNYC